MLEKEGSWRSCRSVLRVGRDVATRLESKRKHRKSTGHDLYLSLLHKLNTAGVTEPQQKSRLLSGHASCKKSVEELSGCTANPRIRWWVFFNRFHC